MTAEWETEKIRRIAALKNSASAPSFNFDD